CFIFILQKLPYDFREAFFIQSIEVLAYQRKDFLYLFPYLTGHLGVVSAYGGEPELHLTKRRQISELYMFRQAFLPFAYKRGQPTFPYTHCFEYFMINDR